MKKDMFSFAEEKFLLHYAKVIGEVKQSFDNINNTIDDKNNNSLNNDNNGDSITKPMVRVRVNNSGISNNTFNSVPDTNNFSSSYSNLHNDNSWDSFTDQRGASFVVIFALVLLLIFVVSLVSYYIFTKIY